MASVYTPALLTFTLTVSEKPISDLETHTLYLTLSAVNLLPLRRVLDKKRRLRELVILLHELRPFHTLVLLRVKHVALDFRSDFAVPGLVPGRRLIGKIPLKTPFVDRRRVFEPADKLFLFPVLACWIQAAGTPCDNCIALVARDLDAYETHQQLPCTMRWVYGETLDGGLQDYICVPQPACLLVKVPPHVLLHDCCFLTDVALPLYAFCHDTLCDVLAAQPAGRILVVLNDLAREANDCLLVIHHLRLDHLLITFTDMKKMADGLLAQYAAKFHHVLVFAPGSAALQLALQAGVSTGLELTKLRYTIALFGAAASQDVAPPQDRTLHRVHLQYKDKFLMEQLLETLGEFNRALVPGDMRHKPLAASIDTLGLNDTALSNHLSGAPDLVDDTTLISSQAKRKRLRFKDEPEVMGPRGHVLWLHCDRDFRLCLDENCDHELLRKCQLTLRINGMLARASDLLRVFYTNRPASHVKINAFIF